MSEARARIAVLVSGEGTNLQVLIDAAHSGAIDGQICGVLSDRATARGLERARDAGIAAQHVEVRPTRMPEYDLEMRNALMALKPDLVVLAGYMRILSDDSVDAFSDRTINLHPSLLPRHKGTNTHQRALDAGDTEHGATVHFVTAELDGGPPVVQYHIDVHADDTAETLSARVHAGEHIILPMTVEWFCQQRLRLAEGIVMLDDEPLQGPVVIKESA